MAGPTRRAPESSVCTSIPSAAASAALAAFREVIPALRESRELKPDVDAAVELVRSGALTAAVEAVTGALG